MCCAVFWELEGDDVFVNDGRYRGSLMRTRSEGRCLVVVILCGGGGGGDGGGMVGNVLY